MKKREVQTTAPGGGGPYDVSRGPERRRGIYRREI